MRRLLLVMVLTGAFVVAGWAFVASDRVAAAAGQPHMQAALRALNNAATQLAAAADDKQGHRVKAIQLVNDAIGQVQAGIAAGAGK